MLLTVGHGTATADERGGRLTAAGVALLVDVRRFPGSRRHPHLAREQVAAWSPVSYRWRGYAAWMRGPDFRAALAEVLAGPRPSALTCSESVWWRCHRRLVADAAVLLHGAAVHHLMPDGRLTEHPPTGGVRVDGDALVDDALA